jgi:delta 1-pyrroline-5-carboxylate dehydrogenase
MQHVLSKMGAMLQLRCAWGQVVSCDALIFDAQVLEVHKDVAASFGFDHHRQRCLVMRCLCLQDGAMMSAYLQRGMSKSAR